MKKFDLLICKDCFNVWRLILNDCMIMIGIIDDNSNIFGILL